ncbi:MAG: hypothetical protein U0414_07365 [Polyangiaceae bacterium]
MALSAPTTFMKSETLTADKLNAAFTDDRARLDALENSSASGSAFRAYTNSQVTLPNGGSTVHFDAESFDTADEYDPGTGKFTTKTGGIYDVNCNLIFDSGQTTSKYYLEAGLFLNGNGAGSGRVDVAASLGDGYSAAYGVHALLKLSAGDAVTCGGYQNSGAPMKLQFKPGEAPNSFSAVRLAL